MLIEQTHPENRVALTVFAHPDDAELACFGLLAKLKRLGWHIIICTVTRGENGADPQHWNRLQESEAAATLIDAQLVSGHFRDGCVTRNGELLTWIEDVLHRHKPALIITHHIGSNRTAHQDHVAVEATVQTAVRRCHWMPTLLLAEGIDDDPGFVPNWFVDITEDIQTKLTAVALHASQGNKYYMQPDFLRLRGNRWALNFAVRNADQALKRYWEAYGIVQMVN